MKKYSFLLILSAFFGTLQINCAKTYSLGPLTSSGTSVPVFTSTFTPVPVLSSTPTPVPIPTSTPTPHTTMVSTLAGSGAIGSSDGTGASASFNGPLGVAVDSSGNVYVADTFNNLIRKITPGGVVTTLAGSGSPGSSDGTGTAASFDYPYGLAVDSSGNIYVADTGNNEIRKITPGGVVTTFAGNLAYGFADGTGTAASFFEPAGIAVDGSGYIYVTDFDNSAVRKITPGGVVTTLAGSGSSGYVNGTGAAAQFYNPWGIAVDGSGNVYVADAGNNVIRKVTSGGVVTTLAGSGSPGFVNGTGTAASFNEPSGAALDSSGNLYVTDSFNNMIRKVTPGGVVTTFTGTTEGFADGSLSTAMFDYPYGVAIDSSGTLYIADDGDNRIREIK